ncbi:maltokinase N-terminal cap-like domain-containing protein [Brevibacterium picturae]|uniref:Maltokinase N-terminal cap domain-containing protein n=1 Tax=Brevibacterium picturae TaxID=260553 RepID=A0ABN2C2K5_9MICO
MAISSELEQLLAGWIPRQSWFPKLAADFGTDPDITPMSVARAFTYRAEELGGFAGLVAVISVGDGPTLRRLNIPLSLRGVEDMHLRKSLIGQVDDLALGHVYVYDGAADPVFVNLMADAITKRKVFDGGQLSTESLRHGREKAAVRDKQSSQPFPVRQAPARSADTPAEVVPPKPSKAALVTDSREELPIDIRPIEVTDAGAHKSTVIIHDEYEPMELSFFRVLENEMPSSLTIPVLLTEAGSRSVPEVVGWGSGRWYDMFEVTEMEAPMALLTHVDVDAEPAWREAVDIVCAVDSGSIGAYNAQAAEMGRRIGELHSDMAAEFGIVEGRGEPSRLLAKKWIDRIDWALGRAPLALDSLVPELRAHRAKLQSLESIGVLQKIHGELTLDHVVSSTTDGYSVVKFTDSTNSDPKPVALDLVALLRSVDYAAGFARLQRTGELESEDGGLVVNGFGNDPSALRGIYDSPEFLWASQVQNSLLSGYSRARGESLGLGDPVLRAALVDRLLVEVVTELRNRPNWLSVPLATLTLVLKGKPARSGDSPAEAETSAPATAADAAPSADAAPAAAGSDSAGSAARVAAGPGADADPATADSDSAASEAGSEGSDKPGLVVEADDALGASDAEGNGGAETVGDADNGSDAENDSDTAGGSNPADDEKSAEPQPRSATASNGAARQSKIRRPSPAEQSETVNEEFEDEEDEFVVSPVPATFAARGAATEDSDSTGRHNVHEAKSAAQQESPAAHKEKHAAPKGKRAKSTPVDAETRETIGSDKSQTGGSEKGTESSKH